MIERKRLAPRLVALVAASLAVAGTVSAASLAEGCVSADVPGRIELPDGNLYPPGKIRICLTERLSPVSGLHETSVGGMPVGLFLSRVGRAEEAEGRDAPPLFEFTRTGDGLWILDAYSVQVGQRRIVYQLRKPPDRAPQTGPELAAASRAVVLTAVVGP